MQHWPQPRIAVVVRPLAAEGDKARCLLVLRGRLHSFARVDDGVDLDAPVLRYEMNDGTNKHLIVQATVNIE